MVGHVAGAVTRLEDLCLPYAYSTQFFKIVLKYSCTASSTCISRTTDGNFVCCATCSLTYQCKTRLKLLSTNIFNNLSFYQLFKASNEYPKRDGKSASHHVHHKMDIDWRSIPLDGFQSCPFSEVYTGEKSRIFTSLCMVGIFILDTVSYEACKYLFPHCARTLHAFTWKYLQVWIYNWSSQGDVGSQRCLKWVWCLMICSLRW